MPVVCLTTDPDNLTNEEYGAFAYGPNVDTSKPTPWIKIATYGQKNWFPAWLEYSDENGQLQISWGIRFRVMVSIRWIYRRKACSSRLTTNSARANLIMRSLTTAVHDLQELRSAQRRPGRPVHPRDGRP